jgi:drug/metabolite transporter (DMT)-like permease
VIIDSQPLTVAILAAVLYGELLGFKSVVALAAGVFGLVLIEVSMLLKAMAQTGLGFECMVCMVDCFHCWVWHVDLGECLFGV